MKKLLSLLAVAVVSMAFIGCNEYREIPPGYIGKILTAKGWESGFHEAGQIDIGESESDVPGNVLVILEATTVTFKEQFLAKGKDGEDHRLLTKNLVPLSVDIYNRVGLILDESGAIDKKAVDVIFTTVTATQTGDPRVRKIMLWDIYDKFAGMSVRGETRGIFAKYADDKAVMENYKPISDEIGAMVVNAFKASNAPLVLHEAKLGNVKIDEAVVKARSSQSSASSEIQRILDISNAISQNSNARMVYQWESAKACAAAGATIVISGESMTANNVAAARSAAQAEKK